MESKSEDPELLREAVRQLRQQLPARKKLKKESLRRHCECFLLDRCYILVDNNVILTVLTEKEIRRDREIKAMAKDLKRRSSGRKKKMKRDGGRGAGQGHDA